MTGAVAVLDIAETFEQCQGYREYGETYKAADGYDVPGVLTAHFSRASGLGKVIDKINAFFNKEIKQKIDPKGWVVRREPQTHQAAVDEGRMLCLFDEDYRVRAITATYPVKTDHYGMFIETGTTLSALNSGTGSLVVALAALGALMSSKGENPIITEIMPENEESMGAYKNKLKWETIENSDVRHELHVACNACIAAENKGNQTDWLLATPHTFMVMARVILAAAENGLTHRASGQNMDIDVSDALGEIGLNLRNVKELAEKGCISVNGQVIKPRVIADLAI